MYVKCSSANTLNQIMTIQRGLVHHTAAWLSEADCLLGVGSLAVFFVGENKNCPEENVVKRYFLTAQ